MKFKSGYLILMGVGGMAVLALIGALASPGEAGNSPFASHTIPTEMLWGVGLLSLMGFNTLARFLFSDLPLAGSWLKARKPKAFGVIACILLCGFLFLG